MTHSWGGTPHPPQPAAADTGYSLLAGLNRIRAPIVWLNLPGVVNPNPSASVMVIDSGVNKVHEDLAGNLVNGLTVTGYSYPPRPVSAGNAIPPLTDPNGHGTHVAGAGKKSIRCLPLLASLPT